MFVFNDYSEWKENYDTILHNMGFPLTYRRQLTFTIRVCLTCVAANLCNRFLLSGHALYVLKSILEKYGLYRYEYDLTALE